jgi:serine/threonine protein kinase
MVVSDLIGRTIRGKYKLIDERGQGSFAMVYIARDLSNNMLYAVKILHLTHSSNNDIIERFKREAHILEKISDPHIVQIVDYGVENNLYFIVMDHIDGRSLKDHIVASSRLEPQRAVEYALQITQGLETADKQGVVHRDIKPQNIIITNKGVVKITDFGLAISMDSPTITHSNEIMGTLYYASPEQLENAHLVDIRSDLYSLGAVLFEMISGRPPFGGNILMEIAEKHKYEPVPSLCQLRPDIPVELDRLVQKAMAKSPSQRFQSPKDMISGLEQVIYILQPKTRPLHGYLVILSTGQTFPITHDVMLIGREDAKIGSTPDIYIKDDTKKVGRKHARLRRQQGVFSIEDLHSLNFTYLNGEKLQPHEPHTLKHGDILRFSYIETRFELR